MSCLLLVDLQVYVDTHQEEPVVSISGSSNQHKFHSVPQKRGISSPIPANVYQVTQHSLVDLNTCQGHKEGKGQKIMILIPMCIPWY